jgi:hypothetical protein
MSEMVDERFGQQNVTQSTINTKKKSQHNNTQYGSRQQKFGIRVDKCNLFNSYQMACEKYQEFEDGGNLPEDIYVVAYHRRFVKKNYFFFNPHQP